MTKRSAPSPFPWFCGGALALNLLLVVGLVGLLGVSGAGHFWQRDLHLFQLENGSKLLAEVHEEEERRDSEGTVEPTLRLEIGNREIHRLDFRYVDESSIAERSTPEWAVLVERWEGGNFYGALRELRRGEQVLALGDEGVMDLLGPMIDAKRSEREAIEDFKTHDIGANSRALEQLRQEVQRLDRSPAVDVESQRMRAEFADREQRLGDEYQRLSERLARLQALQAAETLVLADASDRTVEMPLSQVVRVVHPNRQSFFQRTALAGTRLVEFLWTDPREMNTEGGIFPALFGTVLMVLLMSIAAVPLGVLAALYLREYARQGWMVGLVRIAVNNLAGVPSIVFGVFGLGFFVYLLGGHIDAWFYPDMAPTPKFGTGGILWGSLTLALLTVPVVIVATEEGLAAVPRAVREGSLALGATKFETIRHVVLPAAAPGVLTGVILATARAAGEVAPLMIVGMVKLADVPVDSEFPFVHLESKFMHLGFHIYDLAFQSPNVEAARPMVFATAFLLVILVVLMNLVATVVRNHLRRKYATSAL